MSRIGFDNDKYIELQSERIRRRIAEFGGKLYLEFGGKLFDDYHASRVLPGFAPDSKDAACLRSFGSQVEIIIVINANDIEKNKRRGRFGHLLRRRCAAPDGRVPRRGSVRRQRGHHAVRRPAGRGSLPQKAVVAGHSLLSPLSNRGLSLRREKYRVRRRLRPQRLYRNHAPAGGRDRARVPAAGKWPPA